MLLKVSLISVSTSFKGILLFFVELSNVFQTFIALVLSYHSSQVLWSYVTPNVLFISAPGLSFLFSALCPCSHSRADKTFTAMVTKIRSSDYDMQELVFAHKGAQNTCGVHKICSHSLPALLGLRSVLLLICRNMPCLQKPHCVTRYKLSWRASCVCFPTTWGPRCVRHNFIELWTVKPDVEN